MARIHENLRKKFNDSSPMVQGAAKLGLFLLMEMALLSWLFYPAITQQAAMQWDATEIYLPWKYFLVDQFHHGHWPLWNAYMSGGFPQHGDPGSWYEWSYLFGLDGVYDLQSLLYEYLFHLVVAALGIYVLLQFLGFSWLLAVAFGISYSLNGFFLGNAQHLGWVIGMAWLPWLVYSLMSLLRAIRLQKSVLTKALLLGLIAHWQFVGGYLGVTAIAFYAMLLLWLIWNAWHIDAFSIKTMFTQLGWIAVGLFCFVGLSLPACLSFLDLQSQITRSTTLSISDAQFGHWPWQAISTMWGADPGIDMATDLASDISLINVRWIRLPLLLWVLSAAVAMRLGTSVFEKIKRSDALLSGLLLLCCVGCFLVAVGSSTPVYRWLVYNLPLLKLFRFPSIYRGMALFFLLLSSAYMVRFWEVRFAKWKYFAFVLVLMDVGFGAWRDIKHTVLVQIPAHEVNAVLHQLSAKGSAKQNQLPVRCDVDGDAVLDAQVPFMRLNQGVYLKVWAMDGYNPYQLKSRETGVYKVMRDSLGLLGLDGFGQVVKGGIQSLDGFECNGESINVHGLRCAPAVKWLVCLQNPSEHWVLTHKGSRVSWGNYQGQALKFPVLDDFTLSYQPSYLGWATKCCWMAFLFLIPLVLIINVIREKGPKSP